MLIRLPYGDGWWEEEVPELLQAWTLQPVRAPTTPLDPERLVCDALASPIGSQGLAARVRPSDRIAILVNDATRPCPTRLILDGIVGELEQAGVPDDHVTIVVATGAHRAASPEELHDMLGAPALARFSIVNHDARDPSTLIYCGESRDGVPLWINRMVAEATFRIATGTISPHHSAGYSGGRKMLLPGVAGMDSIRPYHSFPVQPARPALGWLDGNPAHEVALRAAEQIGIHFIVHTVPHPNGTGLLAVVAGELDEAHRAGAQISAKACQASLPFLADLTIASPGGYPRDINLHQSQKALSVAEMVTRPGGVIVLVTECRRGIDGTFDRWLRAASHPQEVLDQYRAQGWSESSGKAMMVARAVSRHTVIVVTGGLTADDLEPLFLRHAKSLREAVSHLDQCPPLDLTRTILIPRASGVVPVVDPSAHQEDPDRPCALTH